MRKPNAVNRTATTVSSSLADADRSDSAWNRVAVAHAAEQSDPLCCRTEWQLSFHEALAPSQDVLLRVGGDSVAAFALHRRTSVGPLLSSIEWGWKFGCPLLGPSAVELMDDLLDELAEVGLRPLVLMSGLVAGTPTWRTMRARRGWRSVPQDREAGCIAGLDGGYDGWLSRRSGLFRRNLRKVERRAEERGVTFERCAPRDAAAAEAAWERILAVERRSWKGLGQCGLDGPEPSRFYGVLLRRLAVAGSARVVFARGDGRDIGFLFGGLAAGWFRAQQFSFDDGWRAYGIGNLLQAETLRWISAQGAAHYHMGPEMDYKPHWAERRVEAQCHLFLPPGHPAGG